MNPDPGTMSAADPAPRPARASEVEPLGLRIPGLASSRRRWARRWGGFLYLSLVCAAATATGAAAAAPAGVSQGGEPRLPAFPGAEGWGAASQGGRGGRVIKVTTLALRGPGSLQEACSAKGPRIVVFEVSGVIPGPVTITEPYITIAGQTAPGGGVTLAGRLSGGGRERLTDVVVRFLRVRPTAKFGQQADDAIQFAAADRLILDHVSVAWGWDETIDLYRARDVTVQWCTIEESNWIPGEDHNTGLITGGLADRISIHHNLFAHHRSRNPCITEGWADIRNNVIYDFRDGLTQYDGDRPVPGGFNVVGNTFLRGPSDPEIFPFNFTTNGKYYLRDNFVDGAGVVDDPWREAHKHAGLRYYAHKGTRLPQPVEAPAVSTDPSARALERVLAEAGAWPRDVVTWRTVREVKDRKGSWGAKDPHDLMAGLQPQQPPPDADADGLPDDWEVRAGLDPAADDHGRTMPSGYSAIEQYLHERAAAVLEHGRHTPEPAAAWLEASVAGPAAGQRPRPGPTAATTHPSPPSAPPVSTGPRPGTFVTLPPAAGDEQLAAALHSSEIEVLHLQRTRVSDAGLAPLKSLARLRVLSLRGTPVSDAGLAHLAALGGLEALDLRETAVTGAGARALAGLSRLRVLELPATVDDPALAELRRALPQAQIQRAAR